jgi:protocatechuate 3,4-dioxygenase beta subunit
MRTALVLLCLACASATPADATSFSIESQVLGPDGKGLAGARVELRPMLRVYDQGIRELEGKQPEPAARAVTEADGWFRFPVPAEGPCKVTVAAEGFPQMFFVWMVIGEETIEPVRMGSKAAEGSRWRPVPPPVPKRAAAGSRPWLLEVHDRGKAVQDALIRDEESGLVIGRTGKDGSLLAQGPKTGGWDIRIETRDGRLASYPLPPIPAKIRANAKIWMKITLPPPVALTGRVVDRATGQPVAGARVWPGEDPAAFQVADSRGAYRLPAWTAKTWVRLSAVAEGHFGTSSESFFVKEDKGTPPTLALWPSSSLAGTIVDEDGQPVAQAEVRIYPAGSADEPVVHVRTSGLGTFRITNLPKDWYDLDARRPGFVPLRIPGVELRPDSAVDLGPLILTRGKRLEGRAIEPRDEVPIEGAEVWVVPSHLASMRAWKLFEEEAGPAAVTDQDGRFVLQGLDPRKSLQLDVCRPGYHKGWIRVESSEEGPIQVELPQAARLSGNVVDLDGKPVSGAHVDASLSGASRPDDYPPSSPCPQLGKFSSTETDAQGRFTLQPLDEGLFEIEAQAEGYRQTAPQIVQVDAGWENAGLTLILLSAEDTAPAAETAPEAETAPADPADHVEELEPHGGKEIILSGRITGIAPEDLPDVEVFASGPGLKFRYGFVDRDGIYRIPAMEPGEWEVSGLIESRSATGKIVIAAGDENPVLDLKFEQEP